MFWSKYLVYVPRYFFFVALGHLFCFMANQMDLWAAQINFLIKKISWSIAFNNNNAHPLRTLHSILLYLLLLQQCLYYSLQLPAFATFSGSAFTASLSSMRWQRFQRLKHHPHFVPYIHPHINQQNNMLTYTNINTSTWPFSRTTLYVFLTNTAQMALSVAGAPGEMLLIIFSA